MENVNEKKWQVTIAYNNDGKFIYQSTEKDSWLALAVSVKQMFAKCPWLDPKDTRLTGVDIIDTRFIDGDGNYEGGPF